MPEQTFFFFKIFGIKLFFSKILSWTPWISNGPSLMGSHGVQGPPWPHQGQAKYFRVTSTTTTVIQDLRVLTCVLYQWQNENAQLAGIQFVKFIVFLRRHRINFTIQLRFQYVLALVLWRRYSTSVLEVSRMYCGSIISALQFGLVLSGWTPGLLAVHPLYHILKVC